MRKIRLGRTGIEATAQSFGALPIQRTETEEAVRILRAAVDGGINYFDTARAYSDSEVKVGEASKRLSAWATAALSASQATGSMWQRRP